MSAGKLLALMAVIFAFGGANRADARVRPQAVFWSTVCGLPYDADRASAFRDPWLRAPGKELKIDPRNRQGGKHRILAGRPAGRPYKITPAGLEPVQVIGLQDNPSEVCVIPRSFYPVELWTTLWLTSQADDTNIVEPNEARIPRALKEDQGTERYVLVVGRSRDFGFLSIGDPRELDFLSGTLYWPTGTLETYRFKSEQIKGLPNGVTYSAKIEGQFIWAGGLYLVMVLRNEGLADEDLDCGTDVVLVRLDRSGPKLVNI